MYMATSLGGFHGRTSADIDEPVNARSSRNHPAHAMRAEMMLLAQK
jgi:hypothetical protein